jgi:hypothetical protein
MFPNTPERSQEDGRRPQKRSAPFVFLAILCLPTSLRPPCPFCLDDTLCYRFLEICSRSPTPGSDRHRLIFLKRLRRVVSDRKI